MQRFDEASVDVAATWRVVRDVLHRDQWQVHSNSQCQTLASGFSQFFIDKLARIRQSIAASLLQSSGQVFSARMHTGPTLSLLAPTSAAEVLKRRGWWIGFRWLLSVHHFLPGKAPILRTWTKLYLLLVQCSGWWITELSSICGIFSKSNCWMETFTSHYDWPNASHDHQGSR